jgi:ADP-dependent NAD(P)H-hydrate dehydratase / NAD(P)H-hydrate epimerase
MGMTGAVDLAASAALHAGAGRVMTCLLSDKASEQIAQQLSSSEFALHHNPVQPEIMPRQALMRFISLLGVVVCGCGGGIAIQKVLPQVLQETTQLVLDADALNAISQDPWLQDF